MVRPTNRQQLISAATDNYAGLLFYQYYKCPLRLGVEKAESTPKEHETMIVGAICNAASFMAKHGFLNTSKHTGNGLEQLKLWGGDNYTNPNGYIHAQAVSDNHLVMANGSATLEFTKELLSLLENDTPERIEMYYQFNKKGMTSYLRSEIYRQSISS